MKTLTSDLLEEINQIRAQYLAEVGSGGYKVWPKSIRDRVLVFADLVGSSKKAADACGISVETIYLWRAEAKKSQFKMLPVVGQSSKSVTVTDTSPKSCKVKSSETGTVTVTTPQGFVFSGFDVDQVLAILLKLGSR